MSAADDLPESRWKRWCLRADPLPLMLLAVAALAWHFRALRTPEVALQAWARINCLAEGAYLFGALAAARVAQLLLTNWCEAGGRPGPHRSPLNFFPWLVGDAVGASLLVWSDLPLRASVRVSRPWLDALADEALRAPAAC